MNRVAIADPDVGDDELDRMAAVIEDGHIADGPEVRAFESAFADYCGTDHAVATSNGTTALHAALDAAGVGAGDRVLTTPFTFVATANAVRLCGAEPVFADVDPETYNLDPAAVQRRLREDGADIDALLVVHLYGLPAPMEELSALADRYDLALVEDAAQAHGAEIDGEHVGGFGDAGTFSFYPTKNMTTAEGGMVTTDDGALADHVRSFINHGRTAAGGYEHVRVGHNFRLTSLAAAIGRAQLEKLPGYVDRRRAIAARYTEVLEDLPGVRPPSVPDGYRHSYHQYTVRCTGVDRDALQSHLDDDGIDSAIYYPTPLHEQPAYADDGIDRGPFPEAEAAAAAVLSLPVHPGLDDDDVQRVVDSVVAFVDGPSDASVATTNGASDTAASDTAASDGTTGDAAADPPEMEAEVDR